jgi:hypothetical protein
MAKAKLFTYRHNPHYNSRNNRVLRTENINNKVLITFYQIQQQFRPNFNQVLATS